MALEVHRFAHEAMATTFEIRFASNDEQYCRQAAAEAFRRLEHLENLLSRFRESSEVSRIGRLAPGEATVVHPDTFACLALALEMAELTGGAFDPSLAPAPADHAVDGAATDLAEPGRLLLDRNTFQVQRVGSPTRLDLGAIGKGFALDCLAEVLAEWQVENALLVAGGSSILAMGGEVGWLIGITDFYQLQLFDGSIGCSGLTVLGHHILDPRTRLPAVTPARAWALSSRAAVSDALSTAFMILPLVDIVDVCARRPECAGVVQPALDNPRVHRFGKGLGVRHAFVTRDESGSAPDASA